MSRISEHDVQHVAWDEVTKGWWRINADLTCGQCGAFQAADSDPLNDRAAALALCVKLFDSVGWRKDAKSRIVCPDCSILFGNPTPGADSG